MTDPALLAAPPAAPPRPAMADLVLLRLLPAKVSIGPKNLRADLGVFFRRAPAADEILDAVAALKAEGFIAPGRGNRATDAGRARALQFLGLDKLPSRTDWRALKARYLVPRALGLPFDSAEYAKVNSGERLAAFLLKRDLALPDATRLTLPAVVDALLCRALGHPEFADLSALIRAKLGEAIGGDPLSKADARTVLPRVRLDVANLRTETLQAVLLSRAPGAPGHDSEPAVAEPEEPFDLEAFAHTANAVARTCPTGRVGDNKVFVSHAWRQLCDEPRFAPLGLDGFKAKLVEANRAELLTLGRADLVQLMDPADVRASEITYLTATFHFIVIKGN